MTASRLTRRSAVALGALLLAAPAFAQNAQPVRLIVGYSAGGPVDAAARQIAPVLSKELGLQVIVENKPGANATIAGDTVAKAAPDGHTLWFAASPTMTISPNVMKKMPFDTVKDLTPLSPVLSYYNLLVVNKDLPFKNLRELMAYAKENPGKVTYGSAGIGASNHLSGELFALKTDMKLTHIPYKGNAPAMTDVIGGQLTMMFDIVSTARNYVAGGRVHAMAVTSPERNPSLPDTPTMAEAGVPGFDVGGWYGVYGPANMPAELVARYNQAINKALKQPELNKLLVDQGYELWLGAPKVLAERAAKERTMWSAVTKNLPQQ